MADDMFGRRSGGDLTIEWDNDAKGWHVDGGPSGPAGLASVELPHGVEIDIDVAEPTEIVGVWLPDVEDAGDAARIVMSATSDRISLARLALAEDVLDGAFHPSDLALALAAVDRALASRAFEQLLGTTEVTARVAHAIDSVHASADDLFEAERPDLIAEALRDLQNQLGPDAPLDALVAALLDAGREQREAASFDLRVAAAIPPTSERFLEEATRPAPVSSLLDVVDLDALPDGLRPEQVAARATTSSEIEIRVGVPVPSKTWWVRVHRHDAIVAVAPILADGTHSGIARLLVPPAHLHHVEVDITVHPDDPLPSSTSRAIDRAVRQGHGAARSDRAERYAAAERGWRDCARGWEAARDKTRMTAALDRSRNSFPMGTAQNPTRGPLLSDLVDE